MDGDETFRKCNYAYNHGGPQEAIEMLNRNLDLNIQKYVSVDFYALAEAVDALGGIELDITDEEASYMNGVGGYIAMTAEITGRKGGNVSVVIRRSMVCRQLPIAVSVILQAVTSVVRRDREPS